MDSDSDLKGLLQALFLGSDDRLANQAGVAHRGSGRPTLGLNYFYQRQMRWQTRGQTPEVDHMARDSRNNAMRKVSPSPRD